MSSYSELEAEVVPAGARVEGRTPVQLAWARFRRDRTAMISVAVLLLVVVFAAAAPLLAAVTGHPYDTTYPKTGLDIDGMPVGPGREFWLGTDQLGRDVLVRAAYGARISLLVGLAATAVATLLGVAVGVVAGYTGGAVDTALARFMDITLALPYLLVAIVLASTFQVTALGGSLALTVLVIAFFSFAAMGRILRGQVLAMREKEFIEAARSLGAGPLRIMRVDILPNLVAPVVVLASLLIPTAIVFESTLSFLGAGVRPPMPSWGSILGENSDVFRTAWWLLAVPGVLLLVTTLSFNLLGDGVRDAVDPRADRIAPARGGAALEDDEG
ncbi:ABC transporter permease [Thermomonospora umbrina]|uniref:Peptide/nickel transport system permease protein n=1 Tax=Thermomonospora umbrina TaxID=111806 RepID=A0A3D9SYT9_9ACTN|nr:ABC transporter permease [Thermomonospora umbrina]REF01009.1 peptide/nickel transport system permease protein [Thermomonospora umbrina]